jgi:hypothetical protein
MPIVSLVPALPEGIRAGWRFPLRRARQTKHDDPRASGFHFAQRHAGVRILVGLCIGKNRAFAYGGWFCQFLRRIEYSGSVGAVVWTFTWVGLGVGFAYVGAQVDPRWAAYTGLSLLVVGMLVAALFGRYLKTTLEPFAQAAVAEA